MAECVFERLVSCRLHSLGYEILVIGPTVHDGGGGGGGDVRGTGCHSFSSPTHSVKRLCSHLLPPAEYSHDRLKSSFRTAVLCDSSDHSDKLENKLPSIEVRPTALV